MKTTAKERQSMLDMALQCGGHVETALALAVANELSVTDRLEDGQELTVPEPVDVGNARVVRLYRAHGVEPATEVSAEDMQCCPCGGIGYMGLEIDFEVS
ncbi:hypothetical protein [Muribaculum intestinale]|uniref:hypothetical protein n=1 Tax=Muribaculum intestinale TaxID=1796646 RepID=UPI0025A943EB|nr:hypothetical protein [Muribaculum intestinale]